MKRPVAVLLFTLAATLALWFAIRAHNRAHTLADIAENLGTINAYKSEQITSWLRLHEREAERLSRHPFLSEIVSEELARPGARRAQLKTWLADHTTQRRYYAMALLSPKGAVIAATPGYAAGTEPVFKAAFLLAAQKGKPQLTDLYLTADGRPHMTMFSPVSAGGRGGRPVCVLVAKIDPETELYPLVKTSPQLFSAAETLLVRKDGDSVLFLNDLDYAQDAALKFKRPLAEEDLPAAAALKNMSGFFSGKDYRGQKVFSSIGHIASPAWAVVTKVDQAAVLGPARTKEYLALALMLVTALLIYGVFYAILLARERSARERIEKAETALGITEQIFREFMEHSPIYVFFKDENIRSLRLSRNFEKMIGRPLGELLGKNMNELFPSDLAKKMVADDLSILREGKEITIEEEFNGRHYITTKFPINLQGRPSYLAGFTIDVTERKRSENERLAHIRFLEDMDQVNRSIQNATDIEKMMGSILNTVLKIFDCDRAWLFYPCDPDAPSFRVPMEVTKPEYPGAKVLNTDLPMPPEMAENLREALQAAGPVIYTLGTEKDVNKVTAEQFGVKSQIFTALYPKVGKPWVFGMHQCSHPRIWTQEEARLMQEIGRRLTDSLTSLLSIHDLRESEQRLKEAQRLAHIGNWTLDLDTNKLSWSDEIYRIFELDPAEFGASYEAFLNAIHPEDREAVNAAYTESLKSKSPYDIVHRLLMPDGRIKYVHECCETLYGKDGKPLKSAGTVQDITGQTLVQDDLRETEERLRTLINSMPDIVCFKDGKGRWLEANNFDLKLFQLENVPYKGKKDSELAPFSPFYHDAFMACEDSDEKAWRASGFSRGEERIPRPDGGEYVFDIIKVPLFTPEGKRKGLTVVGRDITERKRAELQAEKLNRELAEKNKEMENFLYITTHDLRSPLVNIQGFSQNLERYLGELKQAIAGLPLPASAGENVSQLTAKKIPEALDFVLSSSRKMDALITALLKVSRAGRVEMKPENTDMSVMIRKILDAMRFQLEEAGADVKMGALPKCRADQGAVSQIFTNLLDNAVKYRDKSRPLKIEISGEARGGVAAYKVSDNGPGIPEKDLSRIWNVFYSHERGAERKGEGIGLPMVRRMVEKNGGSIKAESKEGLGAVFYVELPAAGRDE